LETNVLYDYFPNFIAQLRSTRAARKSLLENQLKNEKKKRQAGECGFIFTRPA
jgi:hypothetical protein